MGEWSKWELGSEGLPECAVVFGGNTPRSSVERMVGSYERVIRVFEAMRPVLSR